MLPEGAKFWMVWNDQDRAPRKRHVTYQAALEEAQRLAQQNPAYRFYVLEGQSVVQMSALTVTTLK